MISLSLLAAGLAVAATPQPPLLDGVCEPEAWHRAQALALDGGVELRLLQDRPYVYICATLPPGSFGSTDIFIALHDGRRHNLHVSAQVGERTWTGTGWPDWRFGNQHDWYGPPVAFTGLRRAPDGSAQPRFAPALGREVQIAKRKFGRGPWRLRMELRALGPDQTGAAVFPKGSTEAESDGCDRSGRLRSLRARLTRLNAFRPGAAAAAHGAIAKPGRQSSARLAVRG